MFFGPIQKPQVLFFVYSDCPIARRYTPEMNRIANEFGKDFEFRMVYCDPKTAALKKHHQEFKYAFGYSLDSGLVLAKKHGVKAVPTAVVLDKSGRRQYRGRIDDSYTPAYRWKKPQVFDLRKALNSVKFGKSVETRETVVVGCLLSGT
jgi:hypothetical protein